MSNSDSYGPISSIRIRYQISEITNRYYMYLHRYKYRLALVKILS